MDDAHQPLTVADDILWVLEMGHKHWVRARARKNLLTFVKTVCAHPRWVADTLRYCPEFLEVPTIRSMMTNAVVDSKTPDNILNLAMVLGRKPEHPLEIENLQIQYLALFEHEQARQSISSSLEFLQRVPGALASRHLDLYHKCSMDMMVKLLVSKRNAWDNPPVPLADQETLVKGGQLLLRCPNELKKVLEGGLLKFVDLEERVVNQASPRFNHGYEPNRTELDDLISLALRFRDQWTRHEDLDLMVDEFGSDSQKREFTRVFANTRTEDGLMVREIMER